MTVSFGAFWTQLADNPTLLITSLLTMGVIFVNGWTDAPNAIATCVSTRAMTPSAAIAMASVCNFLGVFVMSTVNASVAMTIRNMVDFGGDTRRASVALCAALTAIVVWAVAAWYFGIPTSESHALIAGLSGAAIALQGGIHGIRFAEWGRVLLGLVVSVAVGFALAFFGGKWLRVCCSSTDRPIIDRTFRRAQIASGAAMAFMHGAQDGQKFMGVFLLGIGLTNGQPHASYVLPVWLMVLCSAVMAVGTSVGGGRIIKSVGMDMVKLKPDQGFVADMAGAGCLLLSSVCGLPVSTTHTKTAAVMGVGASYRRFGVRWSTVREMIVAWILTFPCCGLIGYLIAAFAIP